MALSETLSFFGPDLASASDVLALFPIANHSWGEAGERARVHTAVWTVLAVAATIATVIERRMRERISELVTHA